MPDNARPTEVLPTRRAVLSGAAAAVAATVLPAGGKALAAAPAAKAVPPALTAAPVPFARSSVLEAARKLSKSPFVSAATELPGGLKDLSYEQYREIQFRNSAEVWGDTDLPFRLQFFHRGFYYKDVIDVALVEDDKARHVSYSPDYFSFGERVPRPLPTDDIGFAGIRIIGHINGPSDFGEVAVFQGASYFR